MGLQWGVRVGLAWDGESPKSQPTGLSWGRLWPLGVTALVSWAAGAEGSPAAAYTVRSPQNPRLSAKVYPTLNSELPHLAGCMNEPQDSAGPEVAPGLFLGLQSCTGPDFHTLACLKACHCCRLWMRPSTPLCCPSLILTSWFKMAPSGGECTKRA